MRNFWIGLAALVVGLAAPARAEWYEVRTPHVVLKIDDTEQAAREFGVRLERFDSALRRLYGVPDSADRRARPIHVDALEPGLFGEVCLCNSVVGYYQAATESPLIFSMHAPKIKAKPGQLSTQTVLLHEYAHHFAFANIPIAYPSWYAEGLAEFSANASFESDGSVIVGYPAHYRGWLLKSSEKLSVRKLFEPQRYGTGILDLFYGRGWLLTHYLTLNRQRKGQLAAYLEAVNNGRPSLAAAESAFGDLQQLNSELDRYARGQLAPPLRVPPEGALQVAVTRLPPGQAEMMPIHAMIESGTTKAARGGLARRAAKIADKYPDDPVVQFEWAKAASNADRLDEADQALERALRLKPDMSDALLWKGLIAFHRAKESKTPNRALWVAAREWLAKTNRSSPNAVMPLYAYYQSFTEAKERPTAAAVKGLMRAHVLAPESKDVRGVLAEHLLVNGDAKEAKLLLQPIAFAPHSPKAENLARQVIELIDGGKIEEAKAALEATGEGKD